jgi:hypothetical protein
VLCRCVARALLVGERDIERESQAAVALMVIGVHSPERDRSNSVRMSPRWEIGTPTCRLAPGERMIAVVSGLGRQIEGDTGDRSDLAEVVAVERV